MENLVADLTAKYQRQLKNSPEEALLALTTAANALVKTRRRAFQECLIELNILEKWTNLNEQFETFANLIENIQINEQTVHVYLNDQRHFQANILKIEDFLKKLEVASSHPNYILLLGYFSYPERYQLIQVLNACEML